MRINREIRADTVRVVDEKGEQLGVMPTRQALFKAEDAGLDLVEIAPNGKPPVCKIIDFGKLRYQQTKKDKENKKGTSQVKIKEIKMKPNISVHDFDTKANRSKEFLLKGHKVRITLVFRGREMLHMDLGKQRLEKMLQFLSDIATIEAPLKNVGRTVTVVVAPMGKKAKQPIKGDTSRAQNENKQSS